MKVGLDSFSISELKLSPLDVLDWVKEHGFAGVLLGRVSSFTENFDKAAVEEICSKADELGLYSDVSVLTCNPHQVKGNINEHTEKLCKEIELAAECGWHELHVITGSGNERYSDSVSWQEQLKDIAEYIRTLAPVLRANKSRLNIENHGDVTTFEIVRMIEEVGPDILGICLDTANLFCQCESPVRAARRAAPYTQMTHIKDAMLVFNKTGYVRQTLPPGKGIVDWEKILCILAEYNPNLRLSIEDHKWLFNFHVFNAHWLRLHPDLNVEEYAEVIQLAVECEKKVMNNEMPDPETYDKIPYADDMEERLFSARDYLKDIIKRKSLEDRLDYECQCFNLNMDNT